MATVEQPAFRERARVPEHLHGLTWVLGERGTAFLGQQWGDEGKGKWVDLVSEYAAGTVRFQGGDNAGHTIVRGGEKYVFHIVPSNMLNPDGFAALGNGVVVNPEQLFSEIEHLKARGVRLDERLHISGEAHVILPYHKAIDAAKEQRAGKHKVGTTLKGIGPTYTDKAERIGLRVMELLDPDTVAAKVRRAMEERKTLFEGVAVELESAEEIIARAVAYGEQIEPYVSDVQRLLVETIDRGERVIFEGAQGTELDIDHGTYPYVTSSNTTIGGAVTGTGVGLRYIDAVVGVAKAYTTRVGEGPFPTELHGELAEQLREKGEEYGATTGRPRRPGWIDLPQLRRAASVNGLTSLGVTKLDVLSGLDRIMVCTDYDGPPYPRNLGHVEARYREVPGWQEDISNARYFRDLPLAAQQYLALIEQAVRVPVTLVGVGPDRDQTIHLQNGVHDALESRS